MRQPLTVETRLLTSLAKICLISAPSAHGPPPVPRFPSGSGADLKMAPGPVSFGFSEAFGGGHAARSMMLPEMRALVQAMPGVAGKDDIIRAVIDDNVLEKPMSPPVS
jgi:hypothetical protein